MSADKTPKADKTPPKNKGGRPRKDLTIPTQKLSEAKAVILRGGTQKAAANALGVSDRTIRRWKRSPEFLSALKEHEEAASDEVEAGLFDISKGFEYEEVTKELVLIERRRGEKPKIAVEDAQQAADLAETVTMLPGGKLLFGTHMVVTKTVTKLYPPNPTAAALWLTNKRRDGWKNRSDVTGEFKGMVQVRELGNLSVQELTVLGNVLTQLAKTLKA